MTKKLYLIVLIGILLIFSCQKKDRKVQPLLPSVSGRPGEIIVISDKQIWNSSVGDTLRNIFEIPYDLLPQYEPVFDLIQIDPDGFGKIFMTHRNIIIVNISKSFTKPIIKTGKDLHARSQVVVQIEAPDDSSCKNILSKNKSKIIRIFENAEITRLQEIFKNNLDIKLAELIKKQFNISLIIPKGYEIYKNTGDFLWLQEETGDILQLIIIYKYKYTDKEMLKKENLIQKRNEFVEKYIEGEIPGSYITTETIVQPIFREYTLNNHYAAEIRGLWKMEKGIAMGGPFINITMVDEKNYNVVTVEGLIFAAGHKKRNYTRQIEAIIMSMKPLDGKQ